jgi:hypothetical protein
MFRKKPKTWLKEIEEWPTTLDGYGTFLNSATDQIRLICRPDDKMIYKLTNSMEYNDRRLAAFRRALSEAIEADGRRIVRSGGGEIGKIGHEKVETSSWSGQK